MQRQEPTYDFDTIFDEFKDIVYSKVLLTVSDFRDADEITQNVFVKIYFGLAKFKGESTLKTWIYTIVRNTCIDFIRERKESEFSFEEIEEYFIDDNDDFVTQIQDGDVIEYILKMLNLPERNLIIMKYDEGYSFQEIADILKITLSNAKKMIYIAKNKFITYYEQYEAKIT